MQRRSDELSTADWLSIFQQASEMGVLQLHLTGGEPLARPDLTELIGGARAAQLYSNLITSGVGLDERRLDQLIEAGLDHIQLSFQDSEEAAANEFAGTRSHALKLRIAQMIRERRVAFTVNMVVHRRNLDRLDRNDCLRRTNRRAKTGNRQRAILRLGAAQSRGTIADAAAAGPIHRNRGSRPRAAQRQVAHRFCFPRLLFEVPQAVHERLGTSADAHRSCGSRAALSCRCGNSRS